MDAPRQVPLSPEQLDAVRDGGGFAFLVDPNTQQAYFLSEPLPATISEDYVRDKLDEAQSSIDRGELSEWNLDEMQIEVRRRLSGETGSE